MSIYHKHHIVPKHMGGTDDEENLIKLTIEEHAEAHQKLYEEYGKKEDLVAWKALSGQWKRSKIYGVLNKGRVFSEEHKKNISEAKKGCDNSHNSEQLTAVNKSKWHKELLAEKYSKQWEITDPDGKKFIITNLRKWCRDNNIDNGNLMKTIKKGKCKGYSVSRL